MFGMNNDVIGNHVVGHEHGLWTPGSSQPNGRPFGYSLGKVGTRPGGCTVYTVDDKIIKRKNGR
jgi:hypothetical protein